VEFGKKLSVPPLQITRRIILEWLGVGLGAVRDASLCFLVLE
jgi:hypothetical protein